jgi:hypothetical protein
MQGELASRSGTTPGGLSDAEFAYFAKSVPVGGLGERCELYLSRQRQFKMDRRAIQPKARMEFRLSESCASRPRNKFAAWKRHVYHRERTQGAQLPSRNSLRTRHENWIRRRLLRAHSRGNWRRSAIILCAAGIAHISFQSSPHCWMKRSPGSIVQRKCPPSIGYY